MRCPYCGERETRVLDSRPVEIRIRRRRECSRCGKRFTTYEVVERPLLMVQKKDGSLEAFDRQKLLKGVFSAIKKRPVSATQITSMIEEMETQYTSEMRSTVTSAEIGNTVMEKLKNIDAVAYIRFASVYQEFTDVAGFIAAIGALDQPEPHSGDTSRTKEEKS
ncbi:MAG: transcriptional regulator NrdR [Ruminococcus sp.]|uniref:transcriptional regulator NrdR n=1 Tax=unclassified Ruminococcus TaxID=2608920 RepID=UPI00033A6A2E|nr:MULTISPECIES: transcriptional regulator NrdR [unclassified Ruminococcus]MEE1398512.1 transcriptional regulator NrdR [Ruminococcus sp.]CDE11871.1 transcriptional repressor NrdR [Ruminococcus sp. CAG:330]